MTEISPLQAIADLDTSDRAQMDAAMSNRFTMATLERHKREGVLLAVRARWVALAIVAVLLIYLNPNWEMVFYYPFLAAMAFLGWLQTRIAQVGQSRRELVLIFVDVLVFVVTLTIPNPLAENDWPLAMYLRFEGFSFLYILLAGATLSYSWRTIIAVGNWTVAVWFIALGLIWWFSTPSQALQQAAEAAFGHNPAMLQILSPNSFNFDLRIQNAVIFIIVTYTLALSIRRFNRLLINNAALERERENLSRYFSPNVVEELSHNDEPLKQIRSHDVAVIFVDIKGFTRFASDRTPEDVIQTLRAFHARMEAAVFAHGGTLDKYLGDGLMASFGTPFPAEDDARRAYLCARAMIGAAQVWNAERLAAGEPELAVSVGLHRGPVVLGDIGGNRLEFAVIGNTVNVASRIEGLTRVLDAPLVISDDIRAVLPEQEVGDLIRHDGQMVAGIDQPITVWTLPSTPANGSAHPPH